MHAQRAALVIASAIVAASPAPARQTSRVSVDSAGTEADGDCRTSAISADGRFVAFTGYASNLVAGDTNGLSDIFVHDRWTGITERVSLDSAGAEANERSWGPSLSADGITVAFTSMASNLVAGDSNGVDDVFVHDRSTGVTERVSQDSSGAEGNDNSVAASLCGDGTIVAFWSSASNLVSGDANGKSDIFVHDRSTHATERVSVSTSGQGGNRDSSFPAISADGRVVLFKSDASNLVPGDTNGWVDEFVHDRFTGITERVSVSSSGAEGDSFSGWATGSISADGGIVAFTSLAGNLVSGDRNGRWDIFVRDRNSGITERVSVDSSGSEANWDSYDPSMTPDGRLVTFHTPASNLVAGDTNGCNDVFLHDRWTGLTERLSVDSTGAEADDYSFTPAISANGALVAFESVATNLVSDDTNGVEDVFVREICFSAASWSNYGVGVPGTTGIPSFTSQQNPVLGTTITLDLANSVGRPTVGVIFIGYERTTLPTSWGGDLLVVPEIVVPVSFWYGADTFTGDIPDDPGLCTLTFDLQAFEVDPGAVKGVSSTAGLELILGR